jgi:spermidine synthase
LSIEYQKEEVVIWFFVFFFISGFCSVLYELVWLRLSMAQFGVTTAMVSIVLSVFMVGLGWGSWASGMWIRRRGGRIGIPAPRIYAAIEFLIGVSGIVVPFELGFGRRILEHLGSTSSAEYYIASGLWVGLTLIPWCTLMGATIPVAMLAIQKMFPPDSTRSFSYLYMANVTGALFGTAIPLLLVEMLGFHGTLKVGAACNCLIAVLALSLSTKAQPEGSTQTAHFTTEASNATEKKSLLALLFATGLTSMGMEVVWVREFTPFLGTVVYAFAMILGTYLAATMIGSSIYRYWSDGRGLDGHGLKDATLLWTLLPLAALFPLVSANPTFHISAGLRVMLGVAPFAGLLGFLTPMLVDRWSGGNPAAAGKAYAINVGGCILGPLLAGFFLLPWISERWALILLTLPWLVFGLRPTLARSGSYRWGPRAAAYALLPLVVAVSVGDKTYELELPGGSRVMRDSTATVVATGSGMGKRLLVNGYGMTALTPITKMMAHLPLAFLDRTPKDALVICFGMGTTFRSLRSWGIPVTAVELVPSVPRLFGYFHNDASEVLNSPLSHVVVDDGRRYLERTKRKYDVITIDPPPPVKAAGSSLLYSEDFYTVVRQHLRPGGILQQWLPYGDAEDLASVALAVRQSFPYVRGFAYGPQMGFHFLASDQPIPVRNAHELAARLPAAAAADMTEWDQDRNPETRFSLLVQNEFPIDRLISLSPATPALSDDRPINEYYLLRKTTDHVEVGSAKQGTTRACCSR